MKKVQPGDQFIPRAADYNRFIDATHKTEEAFIQGAAPRFANYRFTNIIRIRNTLNMALPRFGVLAIDKPSIQPVNFPPQYREENFFKYMIFDVIVPVERHFGNFAISLQALDPFMVGLALVSGVVPARVFITDPKWEYADIVPGTISYLQSLPKGPLRILWRQATEQQQVVWAVVRFDTVDRFEFVRITDRQPVQPGWYNGQVMRLTETGWTPLYDCYVIDVNALLS